MKVSTVVIEGVIYVYNPFLREYRYTTTAHHHLKAINGGTDIYLPCSEVAGMITMEMDLMDEKMAAGNTITYKIINDTAYHVNTCDEVVKVLEDCRKNRTRIRLDYGDVITGVTWGDVHDITGYIGRSTGDIKILLLVHNKRSYGGGCVLDQCIIGIQESAGGKILYKHPGKK